MLTGNLFIEGGFSAEKKVPERTGGGLSRIVPGVARVLARGTGPNIVFMHCSGRYSTSERDVLIPTGKMNCKKNNA